MYFGFENLDMFALLLLSLVDISFAGEHDK